MLLVPLSKNGRSARSTVKGTEMRVLCLTVNMVAVVCALNAALHLPHGGVAVSAIAIACGFFGVFPVDRIRRLYLFILDKRPRPHVWPTAVLANPQNGYQEEVDWRLIGAVLERR